MAKTGFFFIGPYDEIKCNFCNVVIRNWEVGDNEVTEHIRWSPNCPLLKRRTTPNVAIQSSHELDRLLPPTGYDTCGIYAEYGIYNYTTNERMQRPEYPEFAIESVRFRSFHDWPKALNQKPEELCEAGFFYTNRGDRFICFSCGGGLRDWNKEDVAWEQHALWYETCHYVKLVKGQEYIDSIKERAASIINAAKSLEKNMTIETSSPSAESNSQTNAENNEKNNTNNLDDALYNAQLCKICFTRKCNAIFLPCGHLIACTK